MRMLRRAFHKKLTSKKRKPSWLKELVKETEESVGPPKREVRESKAPERFSSYMAVVTSLRESSLLLMRKHPHIRFGEMP